MATVTLFDNSTGKYLPPLTLTINTALSYTLAEGNLSIVRYVPIKES